MKPRQFNPIPWLLFLTIVVFGNSIANAVPKPNAFITPKPPSINARAYVLLDVNSGKILAEKNADKRRPPASLTKMMTMYVVSQSVRNGQIGLNDQVRISKKAWKTGGSRMFVRVGTTVPAHDLIHGIIVASGNDACVAMAEHVAGSESSFADLMNRTAKQLGMLHSHFTDSTGLPHPNHYTTARDLSILGRAVIRDFPEDYKWYSQKWFTYNNIKQPNRNRLLWRDPFVDGLKTGHTKAAGYCLVSSAKKDGMRLLAVVMGAPTDSARATDSQQLLTYGFRFFTTQKLYEAGQPLDNPRVWAGQLKTIPVGVAKDFYVTVPTGQYKSLKAAIEIPHELSAPITKGQKLGKVSVTLNDKEIAQENVVALKADPKGGVWTRFTDWIGLKFHHWFSAKK